MRGRTTQGAGLFSRVPRDLLQRWERLTPRCASRPSSTLRTLAPALGSPICSNRRDSFATGKHRVSQVAIRMQEDQEEVSAITQGFGPVLKLRALYISWFMINWTDRMWEFSVPFFLLTMDTIDSMRFALIYGASVKSQAFQNTSAQNFCTNACLSSRQIDAMMQFNSMHGRRAFGSPAGFCCYWKFLIAHEYVDLSPSRIHARGKHLI